MLVSLWVQVQPERSRYAQDSIYRGPKKVKVTQRRPLPEAMLPDSRLVKVTIDIPTDHFIAHAVETTVAPVSQIRATP